MQQLAPGHVGVDRRVLQGHADAAAHRARVAHHVVARPPARARRWAAGGCTASARRCSCRRRSARGSRRPRRARRPGRRRPPPGCPPLKTPLEPLGLDRQAVRSGALGHPVTSPSLQPAEASALVSRHAWARGRGLATIVRCPRRRRVSRITRSGCERLREEVVSALEKRDLARDGEERGDAHHHPAEAATDADLRERDLREQLRWKRARGPPARRPRGDRGGDLRDLRGLRRRDPGGAACARCRTPCAASPARGCRPG